MALIFSWRSDVDFNARYSSYGKLAADFTIGGPTVVVDAGAIGGKSADLTNTGAIRSLSWPGRNFINGRVLSVNFRIKPNYTGAPAANRAFMQISGCRMAVGSLGIEVTHVAGTGNITIRVGSDSGVQVINSVSAGAWSPTSGTWYDHSFSWDGTNSANSFKYYINGSLLGSITPTGSLSSSLTNNHWKTIAIGWNGNATTPASSFNEVTVWDEIINFTSNVNLESGTGLLNGSSRSSFISDIAGNTLTSFDGLNYTDPGVANIITTAGNYFFAGLSKTPTYVSASTSNVKTGINFGPSSSLTGTYDGSDRWSDPGESNVSSGVQYKANSLTNNKTGTLSAVSVSINRADGLINASRINGVIR